MVGHGQAQHDSLSYGFYDVRLKEILRKKVMHVDTATADSMLKQNDDDDLSSHCAKLTLLYLYSAVLCCTVLYCTILIRSYVDDICR